MTKINLLTSSTARACIARCLGLSVKYYNTIILAIPYLTCQISLALAASVLEGKPLYRIHPFG